MARRGHGEGSLYKRKSDGRWVGVVELPPGAGQDRRRKSVTAKTKAEAKVALIALQVQLGLMGDMPTQSQTLDEWMTYWFDEVAARRVRAGTLRTYKTTYKNYIQRDLGRVPLDKLSVQHVRRVVNQIDDMKSAPLATYRLLYSALLTAEREGQIVKNPAARMDPPRRQKPVLEQLTPDEMRKVIAHVVEYEKPLAAMWLTFLLTGARRGEVLGLEWDYVSDKDIHIAWQVVHVPKADPIPKHQFAQQVGPCVWKTELKTTSSSNRKIPLVDPLLTILERHRAETGGLGYVFTQDGAPIDPNKVTIWWPRVLDRAGIRKRVRLHDIRHSTITLLLELGVPAHIVRDIAGHAAMGMTDKYRDTASAALLAGAMSTFSQSLSLDMDRSAVVAIEAPDESPQAA